MALQQTLGVYKGENVQLNFGLAPFTLTIQPVLTTDTTIFVQSTAGFPKSGNLYLLPPATPNAVVTVVAYTGITAGSFTGCSNLPASTTFAGALITAGLVDITAWTIQFTLKRTLTDAVALLTKAATIVSGPGGIYRVALAKADTNRLAAIYQHDIFRTDAGSESCLSVGPFQIVQEVLN